MLHLKDHCAKRKKTSSSSLYENHIRTDQTVIVSQNPKKGTLAGYNHSDMLSVRKSINENHILDWLSRGKWRGRKLLSNEWPCLIMACSYSVHPQHYTNNSGTYSVHEKHISQKFESESVNWKGSFYKSLFPISLFWIFKTVWESMWGLTDIVSLMLVLLWDKLQHNPSYFLI